MSNYNQKTEGFNNALVYRQLKVALGFSRSVDELNMHKERIKRVWEESERRVKYILVDWIDMVQPFHVLVSEYSDHYWKDSKVSMDMALIKHHGITVASIPLPAYVIKELGGIDTVARIVALKGLETCLNAFKNKYDNAEMYKVVSEMREQYLAVEAERT